MDELLYYIDIYFTPSFPCPSLVTTDPPQSQGSLQKRADDVVRKLSSCGIVFEITLRAMNEGEREHRSAHVLVLNQQQKIRINTRIRLLRNPPLDC